jgi:hypothetical protein
MKFYLKIPGVKPRKPNIKVGSLVKSDYIQEEKDVIRRITEMKKDETTGSGYRATAEAFKCDHCGRPYGQKIEGVDSAWFFPVKENDDFMMQMYDAINKEEMKYKGK